MSDFKSLFLPNWINKAFLQATVILCIIATPNSYAQLGLSPLKTIPDENGVNLITGKIVMPLPTLSVPAAPRLTITNPNELSVYISGALDTGPSELRQLMSLESAEVTDFIESMKLSGMPNITGLFAAQLLNGETRYYSCFEDECKTANIDGSVLYHFGKILYTKGSGTIYKFENKFHDTVMDPSASLTSSRRMKYYVSSIEFKDGEVLTYTYDVLPSALGSTPVRYHRPVKISSNTGYHLKISYLSNDIASGWGTVREMAIFSDSAPNTPLAKNTYDRSNGTVTDFAGNIYGCGGCGGFSIASLSETPGGTYTLPGDSSPILDVSGNQYQFVSEVKRGNLTWFYNYSNVTLIPNSTKYKFGSLKVTNPLGVDVTYDFSIFNSYTTRFRSFTDALGRTTSYNFVDAYRLEEITYPEGNSESIQYDDCSNIISKTVHPKSGSNLSPKTETAAYPNYSYNFCDIINMDNPTSIKDFNGNVTDFNYNTDGFLTEMISPANASGVRAKTIYEYEKTPLIRKIIERRCGMNTTCGTTNEERTVYAYWNNTFLPRSIRTIDQATGQFLETKIEYDLAGRKISEDGPRTDVDDIVYFTYDILGRQIFEISPDPDGGGPLKRQIKKKFYDAKGLVSRIEAGYGQAVDGSDFIPVSFSRFTRDFLGREIKSETGTY